MGRAFRGRSGPAAGDILKLVLAVVLPPVAVSCEVGLGKHFWINLLLTILGYVPGIVHALYVILPPAATAGKRSRSGRSAR